MLFRSLAHVLRLELAAMPRARRRSLAVAALAAAFYAAALVALGLAARLAAPRHTPAVFFAWQGPQSLESWQGPVNVRVRARDAAPAAGAFAALYPVVAGAGLLVFSRGGRRWAF